ncbi:MAG: VCBS repeat-containing protein, partial [Deltaproteobacteria bacterium]|nr:VCBS repeat-containing protein [Deltaproteobacteria bacterium]
MQERSGAHSGLAKTRPGRTPAWVLVVLVVLVAPSARAQTVGEVLTRGTCDRPSDIMPLARQVAETHLCRYPGELASWSHLGHVRVNSYYASTVIPLATPGAVAALGRVGATLSVNSGFRSVVQQYVMGHRAGCLTGLAPPPGGTHANGCAVDLYNWGDVIGAMQRAGFRHWGSSDRVHFGLVGCPGERGTPDVVSRHDVEAFQILWNANHPRDRIPVNGAWDGTTQDRMNRSPIGGFARNGCAEDRDGDGSPEGEDCDDADPLQWPGAPELCDARDNDCDPAIDEDVARDCGSDVGECRIGRQTCSVGVWSVCAGEIPPADETCDTLDNDCDGEDDEERICEHEDASLARAAFARESTDLDGDGRADACVWSDARIECLLAASFGFDRRIAGPHVEARHALRSSDIDGDGRDDLLVGEGPRLSAWLSRGQSFERAAVPLALGVPSPGARELELWLADVDGDGRADPCSRDVDGLRCGASASARVVSLSALSDVRGFEDVSAHGSIRFGDVDGDGRDDVCARVEGRLACWLTIVERPTRIEGPRWDPADGWDELGRLGTWRLVDLDGDGRDDACARGPDGFACWRSEGAAFGDVVRGPRLEDLDARSGYATLRMADVDGDGTADVCARSEQSLRCWLFTGPGFEREVRGPALPSDEGWSDVRQYESLRLADVSGDGRADACARVDEELVCWIASREGFTQRWELDARGTAGLALGGAGGRRMALRGTSGCAT